MTDRIYYTDSLCREFSATVTRSVDHEGKPGVILDRTAFYPTSGGQPFDTGRLDDRRIVDVVDVDGQIIHVLDSSLAEGTRVNGAIDWDRRFDHMQQHTGQHILSAAFERVLANRTISFHMGAETSTIDLANEVSAGDLDRVETEANRVIWDNAPVAVRLVSREEALRLPLRKESVREGTLRLIEIADFDLSACGGTHVRTTGTVGIVVIVGVERFKGGSRVSFACGGRALRSHRASRTVVTESLRLLSVLPTDLPDAIGRLQVEAKEQRKLLKEARESLAVHDAKALLEGAQELSGVRLVVRDFPGYDIAALKALAVAMTAANGVAVALFTASTPTQVVIARSSDVTVDAAAVLRELIQQYGGKGGGKSDLAQGGGLAGDLRQIVWTASGLVEAQALGRQ